jgi:hypothetical protein
MNIKNVVLSLLFCSLVPAFSAEPQSLLFETRERLTATLGEPQVSGRNDVEVFQSNGWEFMVQFEEALSMRVRVSRLDHGALSDEDIRRFIPPAHPYATWQIWHGTSSRAWFLYGGKYPTYYCVVSTDGRSLLLVCPIGKDTPPDLSDF